MDKNRFKTVIAYHMFSLKILLLILSGILLLNLTLGIFVKADGAVGSIDLPILIFSMFLGFEIFTEVFNFSIINGVARKTYYKAHIISTIIIALAMATVTTIAALISMRFANNIIFYLTVYDDNLLGMFVWFFASIFTIITLFWFMSLVLFRVSKKVKYILIAVLAVIPPIVIVLNNYIDGLLGTIQKYAVMFLGFFGNTVSPYLSALMLCGLAIVIIGISWLFLRRIELK